MAYASHLADEGTVTYAMQALSFVCGGTSGKGIFVRYGQPVRFRSPNEVTLTNTIHKNINAQSLESILPPIPKNRRCVSMLHTLPRFEKTPRLSYRLSHLSGLELYLLSVRLK